MERALYITNYRNIGFGKSERIVLNHSLEKGKMGDLVVVIGANNSGKSNVLDAIWAFGQQEFKARDCTTLSFDEQYQHPQLSLVCKKETQEYTYRITQGDEQKPYVKYPANAETTSTDSKPIDRLAVINGISVLRDMYVPVSDRTHDKCVELLDVLSDSSLNDQSIIDHLEKFEAKITTFSEGKGIWDAFKKKHPIIETVKATPTPSSELHSSFSSQFGYSFFPQVIKYTDKAIQNSQLSCVHSQLGNSPFLTTLFQRINISLDEVKNTYAAFMAHKNRGVLNTLQRRINKKLEEIAKDFNDLYFAENDQYSFEVTLESETIFFVLNRGTRDISLDHQSTGFRWFFNLYFNLLCKNELQPGDIIVMDQPGMDLHIKGREELRRFLKEFARRNDLTIVIATHEPSMIDLDCLDEIRVVSMKDNQSSICNDFAAIDPDDPDCLKPIKEALTVENRILFDPDMNLVFVEGITDYNYLLAFKKLLGFKNLSFLPIQGVGDIKDANIEETQKAISRELIRLKKHDPILLVDSDKVGQSMKKINGQDSCLRVCTLADIDPAFKFIESLFDPEDLKKLGLVDENGKFVKHASDSAVIKNHIESYEFSEVTKENFRKVLQHLDD